MLHYRAVANDPNRSDATRAEAQFRYNEAFKAQREDFIRHWGVWKTEEMNANDPATGLALRHQQLANEKAIRDLQGEGWVPLSPEKMASLPTPPAGQIIYENRRGELKFGPTPPATTTISLGEKGENKAVEAFHTAVGKDWAETLSQGMGAADDLNTITELRKQIGRIDTGAGAVAKSYLGKFGIRTEGLDDIQAMQATLNRLIPAQRLPGSGATSDFDARGFRDSLPALINTRGGNLLIADTMEGLARNKMERAEVVTKWATGEMKMADAIKEMVKKQHEARILSDNVKAHMERSGVRPAESTVPPGAAPTSGGPIQVQTPDEARRLPSGTPIILPDGTPGRVP